MKSGRDGFVLLVVLFLLFAVGVSAAATYQISRSEHLLSSLSADVLAAQSAIDAGLMRYIGEAPLTGPLNYVEYTIEQDGTDGFSPEALVQILPRKVMDLPSGGELYRIAGVARVTNRRFFEAPVVREAAVYATRESGSLMERAGGLVTTASSVMVGDSFSVSGFDHYTGGITGCPAPANRPGSTAVGHSVTAPLGSLRGTPPNHPRWSVQGVLDELGLPPWDAITDAELFPADYEYPDDAWPNFAALPGSTFPTIRVDGDLVADMARSGRGLLVVSGTLTIGDRFIWNGVILSGGMANATSVYGTRIEGLVVGVIETPPANLLFTGLMGAPAMGFSYPSIRYHSCNVFRANRSIGVVNLTPLTWWSGF
jgi:hypothetical protein